MYAKIFTLAALVAAVVAVPTGGDVNKCNVNNVQCCNSVQSANSQTVQGIAQGNALVAAALALAPITVPVGVTCSPITAVGIAGNSWLASSLSPLLLHRIDVSPAMPSPSAARTTTSVSPPHLPCFLSYFQSLITSLSRRCCRHRLLPHQRQPLNTLLAYIHFVYPSTGGH